VNPACFLFAFTNSGTEHPQYEADERVKEEYEHKYYISTHQGERIDSRDPGRDCPYLETRKKKSKIRNISTRCGVRLTA